MPPTDGPDYTTTHRTTYSDARARLAVLWDQVERDREPVVLTRYGHEDLALIPAADLRRLQFAVQHGRPAESAHPDTGHEGTRTQAGS